MIAVPGSSSFVPRSSADRAYEALKRAHAQFTGAAESEADLPAWYVLTSAGPIRIKTIGTFGPFVQFVTPDGHVVGTPPRGTRRGAH